MRGNAWHLSHLCFFVFVLFCFLSTLTCLLPPFLAAAYSASPASARAGAPVAVWKGHSFNTISGPEAESSAAEQRQGDSDFSCDNDSNISGDALAKDLCTRR